MAVTGGNCYSTYAKNTRFRIDWDRTGTWSDNSGCGSIIKWRLVLENRNQWYSNAVRCYEIYINGSKVSDGGTWSNFTSHEDIVLIDWQSGVRIAHNNAGNEKTFNINFSGWFYSSYNVSGSTDFTLPSIPRGTSVTGFSVDKWNETELKFNWSTADNIDELWYSTDNGATWSNAGISGTSSGYFFVSNLAPNTTYYCKISVKRNTIDTQSGQVVQTTYAIPNQWLVSATETTMTIGWSLDSTASHIWYTIDGSGWVDVGDVNATSGTYTISGLGANTGHNITTIVRRKWAETDYASPTYWYSTYAYPYLTASQDFVIGNSVTVNFYNPLNRDLQIQMWSHGGSQFVTDLISIGQVSQYTFTPDASRLYASIPNGKESYYNIDVWYDNNKAIGQLGNKYIVNESASTPTFSNFEYKDTASNDLISAIDDDQVLVQNVSNVNVVISSANKMVAKNSATASKYQALFSNLSKTFNYSASDIDTYLGIPTGSGNSTFKVTAYDSRNIAKEVSKTINIIPYSAPLVNVVLARLNNFEAETHLKLSGTFARVTIGDVDKNAIQEVKYRYKESSASTWGEWTTMTIYRQGSGSYETTEVTLSLDNTKQFTFEFAVTDKAKTTSASQILSIGKPLMFLHTSGKLEVNGEIQAETNVLSPSFESEQAHGFKTDTFFNFHHKDASTSDNWSICSNDGAGKFTVYPETGNTIVAGDLSVNGTINNKHISYFDDTGGSDIKEMLKAKIDLVETQLSSVNNGMMFFNGGWSGHNYGFGLGSKIENTISFVWISTDGIFHGRKYEGTYSYQGTYWSNL